MNIITVPDNLFDVNFWKYDPKRPLKKDDYPASMLLYQSFLNENKLDLHLANATTVQDYGGLGNVLWGYKKNINGLTSWEYYFYLHKQNPQFELSKLMNNLGNYFVNFESDIILKRDDYFLISFDIEEQKQDFINIYFPDLKTEVKKIYINQSKHYFDANFPHAYLLKYGNKNQINTSNYYYGFYPWPIKISELKDVIMLATERLYNKQISDFLNYEKIPFLQKTDGGNYQPISIAVKKQAIGLYFIDVEIQNFIAFLNYFKYPDNFITHVFYNTKKYDYLKFDISFDMQLENNTFYLSKGAFYGTL